MAAKEAYAVAFKAAPPAPPRPSVASPEYLIVSPTRELARQTSDVMGSLLQHTGVALSAMAVIGGEDFTAQRARLIEVLPVFLVATPGRLLNLCGFHSEAGRSPNMQGTALSGPIFTILTVLSSICVGIHMCGALPYPVLA